jgi:hypothetical protein
VAISAEHLLSSQVLLRMLRGTFLPLGSRPALLGATTNRTQVGAEAQAVDADFKRNTPTIDQVFEERFQTARAPDGLLDFLKLSMRQFLTPKDSNGRPFLRR